MAEDIEIPSPSVFLRSSPPPTGVPKTRQDVRRPSTEKKKTARKSSAVGDSSAVKQKQTKSRNGCITCKTKRLKCGEEKPACEQCKKRKVECGGYKKDFKWRPFEETNVKLNIDRQMRVSPPQQPSGESSKPTTPVSPETSPTLASPTQPLEHNQEDNAKRKDSKRTSTTFDEHRVMQLVERPMKAKRKSKAKVPVPTQRPLTPEHVATASTSEKEDTPKPASPIPRKELTVSPGPSSVPISSASAPASMRATYMPSAGLSPTLTEILQPFADDVPLEEDYVSFDLPEGLDLPFTPRGPSDDQPPDEDVTEDEEFEDIFRNGDFDDTLTFGTTNSYSPSPIMTPTNMTSLWQGPVTYVYNQPYFAPNSPEMLTFRFDRLTCGILSVMDGQTENPWRNLIWPLAQKSPALYHAVMAMTAYHSCTDVPALRVSGHEHKQASIRYIQEGIRDNSMNDQTAIATALALGFSESWDQHTASGNTHIKGAQALVKRALFEHQLNPLQGVELARLKFLCNAWVYMDVIARLTSVDSDESNDFDNTLLFATEGPNMVMGNNALSGFGIDFGMPVDARLDPLMGCANTLFPLIGRVANLVRKVCRSQTNSPGVISAANDLKLSLETWEPPAFIEDPEDPTCIAQHALQTAEAYRWATLLHLHQSVPELPSDTSLELAQRVLQYLATVPLASRTVIVQIYPLMVAGCEAKTMEDRQWVRDRWAAMGQRMRIGVIDKSATVTEEVWRRRDAYDAQPRDRRKLVATAELQPARQRGAPLVRTDTGFRDADPGKTGMVFSYVEAEGEGSGGGNGGGNGGGANKSPSNERFPPRLKGPDRVMGPMDAAYTVRGHLHWVGVMWDWGWEVLLG